MSTMSYPVSSDTQVNHIFSSRKLVSVLAALFGISSWIEVNGLWVELPLLVAKLPEAGYLASYIVVLTQAANLGPLLYSLAKYIWKDKVPDKFLIHLTMLVGTSSCALLIFFWDRTSYVGGVLHSTAFLVLALFLATVDCTSSVLYLPFMGKLRQQHFLPFLIGEGFSGLIPALVALAQGVGGNPTCVPDPTNSSNTTIAQYASPRFSIEIFFIFLVVMLLVSWAAFTAITLLPATITEQVTQDMASSSSAISNLPTVPGHPETSPTFSSCSQLLQTAPKKDLAKRELASLLFLQALICCLTNGILPAIQTFSCLPYGNVAYHLAVTLSSLSQPLACFVALRWWSSRTSLLASLSTLGLTSAAYLVSTAALSPTPPLVGTKAGEAILVLCWIVFAGSFSYVRACIASRLREAEAPRALFYLGALTQVGSFAGAILSFSLVNFTNIFVFYMPCS